MPDTSSPQKFRLLLYPRILIGLLALALAYLLLQTLWDAPPATSWKLFFSAAGLGAVGLSGWWVLSRTDFEAARESGRYGGAWLGFPLCALGIIGMVPLLVLAVSNEARLRMNPNDLIEARAVDGELEIRFPQGTSANTVNLSIDDEPIPFERLSRQPDTYRWENQNHRLRVRTADLDIVLSEVRSIRINAILTEGAQPMRNALGKRIPQQRIVLGSTP